MPFDPAAATRRLNAEIATLRFGEEPPELYEPLRYLMRLGGKRLRPLLVLFGYTLYQDDWERVLRPAVGVEVFHNFTLVHDDIMDAAPLRRGEPTVHEKWNPNVAILSGDVMLVRAYELLMEVPDERLRSVLARFSGCAAAVCEGQQLDMNYEAVPTVSEARYLDMIRLKTAVLLGFALELGGLLAGADTAQTARLRQAGTDFGVGFQLQDDLLDVYGEPGKFGKQVGGDIMANKKTFLLIRALASATGTTKAALDEALSLPSTDGARKVLAVRQVYDHLDVAGQARAAMREHFDRGFAALEALPVPTARQEPLRAFARTLIAREN